MDQKVDAEGECKVTVVARVVGHELDGRFTQMNGVSPDQLFFYLGGIFGAPDELWTLYDIERVGVFQDHPVMALGKDSEAFCHQFRGDEDYTAAWDFCFRHWGTWMGGGARRISAVRSQRPRLVGVRSHAPE